MKKRTVGFFGDSFCADKTSAMVFANYETYIQKLTRSFNLDILHLGYGGSSVYDVLINQLNPIIEAKSIPDICIFVWTTPGRLFHRKIRRINYSSAVYKKENDIIWNSFREYFIQDSDKIWNAAKSYYDYLADSEKDEIEYVSLLQYIDNNIFSLLSKNSILIHLWSYGKIDQWNIKGMDPSSSKYHHRWKHGAEIRPHLASIGLIDYTFEQFIRSDDPNHLVGDYKNQLVHDIIKDCIDNYESGKLFDNIDLVKKHWK